MTLCIRPEFIKVEAGDSGHEGNIFRGRVESLVFVGEAYEGEIRIGDTRLIIRIEPTDSIKEGDEIAITFEPDHCFAVPR